MIVARMNAHDHGGSHADRIARELAHCCALLGSVTFLTAAISMPQALAADQAMVTRIEFIGADTFPTGTQFAGTEIGGLSGITYDANGDLYYVTPDHRGERHAAHLYRVTIDVGDGALDEGDVRFRGVIPLLDSDLQTFTGQRRFRRRCACPQW